MAKINMTARWAQGVQPPEKGQVDHFDTKPGGLILRVSAKGVKSWCILYRYAGRLRRLTLGQYPILSLADARELAVITRRAVMLGEDPASDKQARRHALTVADLADQFIDMYARVHKRSWRNDARMLGKDVLPHWGRRPAGDIKRQDVIALLDGIVARGAPVTANRVLSLLHKLFGWAVSRDILEYNPCTQVQAPGREVHRDRVLSEDEIRAVWAIWQTLPLERRIHFELRLLTAQRGGEVISMAWDDIDLQTAVWTIPAALSKNGLAHRVPLADPVMERLHALYDVREGPYVFRSPQKASRHISVSTIKAQARQLQKQSGVNFELHDLRRTAASHMAQIGVPRLVISKVLNHAEGGVTSIYDRHAYDAEKRHALNTWARRLMAIVGEGKPAKVIQL